MNRLSLSTRVTKDYLRSMLFDLMRDIETKVNALAEGRLAARHNAQTAAPTTGTHAQGDFVPNSAPAVAGGGGSQYVITGWICTASGTPGTWVECRTLTGT
jgi:hypothetical protein